MVLALSFKTPTYYYPPLTIPISLLPSSPARSNIKQLNSKLGAFIKAELILIKENYNFKLLKHALLNSTIGHIKLYRIGLIYRLINYIVNCLEDFRID